MEALQVRMQARQGISVFRVRGVFSQALLISLVFCLVAWSSRPIFKHRWPMMAQEANDAPNHDAAYFAMVKLTMKHAISIA